MLKPFVTAAALLFVSPGTHAVAQTRPPGLTWMVISELNGFYDDVDDPTNRPALITEPPPGVLTARDIDQDGAVDWIVIWPASSQFCGTGGCRVTIYLGAGENLRRIFDRQILDELSITQVGGELRIESRFHHGGCHDPRDECRMAWGLDATTGRLVPRPSANGDTFSSQAEQKPIDETWDEQS